MCNVETTGDWFVAVAYWIGNFKNNISLAYHISVSTLSSQQTIQAPASLMIVTVEASHRCGPTQIWDPFSEVCRDVFCAGLVEEDCQAAPNGSRLAVSLGNMVAAMNKYNFSGLGTRRYPSRARIS